MFDQGTLRDELQSLKIDLASMLKSSSEDILGRSKTRADAVAEQIKAALSDLGDVLAQEEGQIEKLIADRPVAALAAAFAVGLVIGLALRRH